MSTPSAYHEPCPGHPDFSFPSNELKTSQAGARESNETNRKGYS